MITTKTGLLSQIPRHILENNPRFVDFVEAYYAWLSEGDTPYKKIKKHLDYLAMQDSIDEYVSALKHDFLFNVPESVLLDKELFIKWSKRFYLSRGSDSSFKFIFRVLFDEDITIYGQGQDLFRLSNSPYNEETKTWEDNSSFLSDTVKLTDSKIYQDYAYVIKNTEQDISKFATTLKRLVHPSGFLMVNQATKVFGVELNSSIRRI